MVRKMKWGDIPVIARMFPSEIEKFYGVKAGGSLKYYQKLVGKCYDSDCSFVIEKDGKVKAAILVIIDTDIITLHGRDLKVINLFNKDASPYQVGKMLLAFNKESKTKLNNNTIDKIVVTSNIQTNLDWSKLGFTWSDTIHVKRE